MIKLLVVDDEYLVRLGIRETIDWSQYGIEIIGEAENGSDALQLALVLQPDIVITDIRMPIIDGLELIENLNAHHLDSEILILTGFDEFNYAKKALENGAGAYLLKPINNDELIQTIIKLKLKVESKKKFKQTIKSFDESIPFLREKFLQDLILGKINDKVLIEDKLSNFQIPYDITDYCVIVSQIDNYNHLREKHTSGELDELKKLLIDYAVQALQGDNLYGTIFRDPHENSIVILQLNNNDKSSVNSDTIFEFCNTLKMMFNLNMKYTLTFGISNHYNDIKDIQAAYNEAKKAVEYKSITGRNRIIHISDVTPENGNVLNYSKSEIELIISLIKKNDFENALESFNKLLLKITELSSLPYVKKFALEFYILVTSKVFDTDEDICHVFGDTFIPNLEIHNMETIHDVASWLTKTFEKILNYLSAHSKLKYRREIQEAIEYINQNYSTEVTVERIAEKLFISPYYLMHLFKQEVGKTFSEYLIEYRIEKAKELLKNSRLKIYEISEKVGYNSTKYFSQLFKKITGLTPSEYIEKEN